MKGQQMIHIVFEEPEFNIDIFKVEINDNRLTTEKEDKQKHGYGTVNATNCVEQNGGSLSFSCTDTHFTAELILPNINC